MQVAQEWVAARREAATAKEVRTAWAWTMPGMIFESCYNKCSQPCLWSTYWMYGMRPQI